MRTDLRDERRLHSALQLEAAALGMRAGFAVALESRAAPGSRPSDVVMLRDEERLRVETFAILRDEGLQEAARYWDWLMAQVRHLMWQHDAGIDGDISKRLDHDGSAELLRLIDAAARSAVATGDEQAVEFGGSRLRVLPPGSSAYELRGVSRRERAGPGSRASLFRKPNRHPRPAAAGCAPTSATASGSSPRGPRRACAPRSAKSRKPSKRYTSGSPALTVSCSPAARSSRKASSAAIQPERQTSATGCAESCLLPVSAKP
jgi:hypothetical protein